MNLKRKFLLSWLTILVFGIFFWASTPSRKTTYVPPKKAATDLLPAVTPDAKELTRITNSPYRDFGASIRDASTFGKKIVALPINQEGPLFYWRKDIFEKCKINEPMALEDIPIAAAALKTCDPSIGPWAARGLRSSVPYALTAFINNLGGNYSTPDGKPGLSQDNTLKGLILYSNLLKDYGPPGALNHTFRNLLY
jgi:multiple sugar transport system substrate-binding protein